MSRILFARGSRGRIIQRIQTVLQRDGYYTGRADGFFGGGTERAVHRLQMEKQREATGKVDVATWEGLMGVEIPRLQERCLQLTAALEGHGFGRVQGNWDGAWLTWGIIGFTLKHGQISKIVLEVYESDAAVVREAFGSLTEELLRAMRAPQSEQESWANRISIPPKRFQVLEPWRSAFSRFGDHPAVEVAQIRQAIDRYFTPSLETATEYGLKTELGAELCFDIRVQNGGIGARARAAIQAAVDREPPENERSLRVIIASAVASNAKSQFRGDVLSRKIAIASGAGPVHGEFFQLENWGLGEYPWQQEGLSLLRAS
ncbi:MAG: peptidoglycan-binding protein [Acidobacteria bacterium]|nr:peptidoglycan-binding protein [Acidobacteriota bacterium]